MKIFIVVVDEVSRVGGVLDESLDCILREELSIRLGNAPGELGVEETRGGGGEEVDLAVEGIEDLVQPGGDVPLPRPYLRIKGLHLGRKRNLRIVSFALFLWNTLLLADCTGVKHTHHFVLKEITALYLASRLVLPS